MATQEEFEYRPEPEDITENHRRMAYDAAERMDRAARSAAAASRGRSAAPASRGISAAPASRGISAAAKRPAAAKQYAVSNNPKIKILAKEETRKLIEYYTLKRELEMKKGDTTIIEKGELAKAEKAWMDAKTATEDAASIIIKSNRGERSTTMTTGGNPRGRKSRGRKSRGRKSRGRKTRGRR
jgi:hypothetical protein